MLKDEEETEEDTTFANTRYPCMPSLVALQQMRNRLHLAYVGKKLMKWTAQATGRELRKLAWELNLTCKSFSKDMRDAFMLLARARYFYPNLNKMVLEHIGHEANVTVDVKTKSISGVKVLQLDILDIGQDNYQHLGIDKGGHAIQEAKKEWKEILKKVILILEQRTSFEQVDLAHRSATKRKNVLSKIIIPKLKMTIKFILSEVEEKEREDVFRLKRFKQLKSRKKQQDLHICCCCLSMFASEEDLVESVCPVCKKAAKAKGKVSDIRLNVVPCKSAVAQGKENKKMLDHLMSHIDDVIDLTRQYKLDGIVPASIDTFIKTCHQVKETIEDYANAPPLCDVCKKFLEATGSRIKLASKTGSYKSLEISTPGRSTEAPPCTESCYNLGPEPDDKLGYFEKKFKEIVKVTRLQNEDGSVSEEKQVITIRTERRNPRKTGNFDSMTDDNKFIGGGRDYGGKDYGGGTDYGGDGGSNFRPGPRETKSEHANRSHQMGEPRLRSCLSGSHLKTTMKKDASTNFDSSRCMSIKTSKITLPPTTSTNKIKTCGPLPKISKSSSIDSHVCCPKKTESVCGSELESGGASQASVILCKPVTKSASSQTCCKEVPVKKPMEDKGTCCLPTCGGDKTCPDNKDNKFKTTSTEALWRDAWTSTTDLVEVPSSAPSKGPSRSQSKKASPAPSCSSKDSSDSVEKKHKKKSGSCCTIKIIAKPPKICCFDEKPKEEPKEVVLPGSMFETIKKIFLPPTRSTESCKIEPTKPEIKNICKSCLSKLSSFAPSAKSSVKSQSSSCKMCQASITSQPEDTKSCPSCGTLTKSSSCGSMSCKSMAIGSSTSQQVCQKSPTPSQHNQKHKCCLEKKSNHSSSEEEEQTCCAMAQTYKSSKSICCSKKKTSSVCCPAKSSKSSIKPKKSESGSCCAKTDATTSTKRSARYDVRPLRRRHTCEKINLGSCTCKSDPHMNRTRGGNRPAKRSQSFYEDEYYFFRW